MENQRIVCHYTFTFHNLHNLKEITIRHGKTIMRRLDGFIFNYYILSVSSLFLLLGLCALDYWLFKTLFSKSFFAWYLHTGPVIQLIMVVAASVYKGLDKDAGLISVDPLYYIGSYLRVSGLMMFALGTIQRGSNASGNIGFIRIVRMVLETFVMFVIGVIVLVWLSIIVPLQYFIFVICGSVPRSAVQSSMRIVAREDRHGDVHLTKRPVTRDLPKKTWDATMRDDPFKLTSAISAAFLFLLSTIPTYAQEWVLSVSENSIITDLF